MLVGVGLPWVALWGSTRLRSWIASCLATDRTEVFGTRSGVAALIVIQTAIWPVYLMLVAWAWPRIIVAEPQALDQELSLLASVQWSALVLWGWLVARALLHPQGWMQRYWGLRPEVGKALQQTVTVGCLATLVFLVPRHALVHAPGGPEAVAGSLALLAMRLSEPPRRRQHGLRWTYWATLMPPKRCGSGRVRPCGSSSFLRAFGDHALQWEISCFVPRPQDRPATAYDLLLQIDQMFRQHAIAIPFPQQDVRLRSADATLVSQPARNGYETVAAHTEPLARDVP